jgi:hypothetical protein
MQAELLLLLLLLARSAASFSEALRMGAEVYHNLKNLIKDKYGEQQGAEWGLRQGRGLLACPAAWCQHQLGAMMWHAGVGQQVCFALYCIGSQELAGPTNWASQVWQLCQMTGSTLHAHATMSHHHHA